jgi:hypothetical protein
LVFSIIGTSHAGKLYLKDGGVEESDRIWESEKYVHFILKGTRSVEVRYAKEFVLRIENDEKTDRGKTAPVTTAAKPQESKETEKKAANPKVVNKQPPLTLSRKIRKDVQLPDRGFIEKNRGMSFYDPHRPKRYWAAYNSKHTTLEKAIAYLAEYYSRPIQWIEDHMGEENDLGIIHEKLSRQLQSEKNNNGDEFTRVEDQSEKIVSENNRDEDQINDHVPADLSIDRSGGTLFYDPRRAKKYWISPQKKFDSLDEAMAALADMYGVEPKWIEENMGETNNLRDIHNNIKKSLSD